MLKCLAYGFDSQMAGAEIIAGCSCKYLIMKCGYSIPWVPYMAVLGMVWQVLGTKTLAWFYEELRLGDTRTQN